jgi:hypothetical protein
MAAAQGRVLVRVVALLAAAALAAAAAGNSAVVSLRGLDGREARSSRYAAQMLGNSEF